MDDFEFALTRVDVARGYSEYIPGEDEGEYPEEDEESKFNSVLDSIEQAIKHAQQLEKENDVDYPVDFEIDSKTDIAFAIANILNQAEENGVDPDGAKQQALGYVKGRQTKR